MAKDRDNLRFRASEDFNAIIREEAARTRATVVETRAQLAAYAKDGIIGSDLMLEHLHPNLQGYFISADAFYDALYAHRPLASSPGYISRSVARQEVLYTAVDSLFGALRVRQLMSSWPIEPPGMPGPPMDTTRARSAEEGIALEYFHRRLGWYEATDSLRSLYESRGDLHKALRSTLAIVQQYPYLGQPYALAADILLRQRRNPEALVYYEAANELEPTAQVHYMMGMIHVAAGQLEEALVHLELATDMEPRNTGYLLQLTQAYLVAGQLEDAQSSVRQLLGVVPDHRQGLRLYQLIKQQGG